MFAPMPHTWRGCSIQRNAYFAWSDQMLAGVAVGSKYYPRGVTSALWLLEK